MTACATSLLAVLKASGDKRQADRALRFFKTGKDQYGEGERFFGVLMPQLRMLAKEHVAIPLNETLLLLHSDFHEARLLALLIMVNQFRLGDEQQQNTIARSYLQHTNRVNNWSVVDCSAHLILGPWLEGRGEKDRAKLDRLAKSNSLWERRIAMIATFHFIRNEEYDDALRIAAILVNDSEDLIHKAVGWMLREIGNRNRQAEEAFLMEHYKVMPRTMLRYAIEKFPDGVRKAYLEGKV